MILDCKYIRSFIKLAVRHVSAMASRIKVVHVCTYLAFHFTNDGKNLARHTHYNEYASYPNSLLIILKYSTILREKASFSNNNIHILIFYWRAVGRGIMKYVLQ